MSGMWQRSAEGPRGRCITRQCSGPEPRYTLYRSNAAGARLRLLIGIALGDEMAAIAVGEYTVTVSDEYSVEEFNQFRDMPAFLRDLPFDWEAVKRTPTVYTVRFGSQWLCFHAWPQDNEPDDLAEMIFDQTRVRPPLEDVVVHGIAGKAAGGFGDSFSCKEWWLKANGSHVISFRFEGPGPVSEQTRSEVARIMNTVRRTSYAA